MAVLTIYEGSGVAVEAISFGGYKGSKRADRYLEYITHHRTRFKTSTTMGSISPITSRSGMTISQSSIDTFTASIQGEVLVKGQGDKSVYTAAIARFNRATISEAAIIVFVSSEEDVGTALKYAQEWDLEVVISCGRHSYYGASSTSGGLVIDLRKLKKVEIDVEGMSITAGGGCQAVDLETPLQELGLSVVMGAANDTGIGGLTLGGGSGFLTGQYGLVIDNLLSARVVLANGRVLEASEEKNPDLFWGIRGGGSNFGVVTEFKYRVHRQGDVFFGPIVYTPDKTSAIQSLAPRLQQIVDSSSGKLAIFIAFARIAPMPSINPLILVFYDGPESAARSLLSPVYDLGPIADKACMKKYAECTMDSPEILGPETHRFYSTSSVSLPVGWDGELVGGVVEDVGAFLEKWGDVVRPSKVAVEIRSYEVSGRVRPDATALWARDKGSVCMLNVQYDGSVGREVMREEVVRLTEGLRGRISEGGKGGGHSNPNFAVGGEGVEKVFGENLGRLREVKRRYDPEGVFRKWFPIEPALPAA
ncbi:FAD-binding domain-containing protein [Cadophora sp. DSE1049]|nr:FAD-binding domain-containing protein [Cadophora sp. DSE1049]